MTIAVMLLLLVLLVWSHHFCIAHVDAPPSAAAKYCAKYKPHAKSQTFSFQLSRYDFPTANQTSRYVHEAFDLRPLLEAKGTFFVDKILFLPDSRAHLHHINLYRCPASASRRVAKYVGNPTGLSGFGYMCRDMVVLSNRNADPRFCVPPNTAFYMDPASTPFLLLEVHLEVAPGTAPFADSSGISLTGHFAVDGDALKEPMPMAMSHFYVTSGLQLRLPPGKKHLVVTEQCALSRYERVPLRPDAGTVDLNRPSNLRVFAIMFHAHTRGRRHWAYSVNERTQRSQLLCDNFEFEHHKFVVVDQLNWSISSEDTISLSCEYDTTGETRVVQGGFTGTDEMCSMSIYMYTQTLNDARLETAHEGFCDTEVYQYSYLEEGQTDVCGRKDVLFLESLDEDKTSDLSVLPPPDEMRNWSAVYLICLFVAGMVGAALWKA
jgi:hypothetical protein